VHGINYSIFIMLTKEDLIEAHEQGLNVQTKGGTNFKIVAYIHDAFAVQYSTSTTISWYSIDKINELQCSIEQPKPKYNGKAVKCDSVEQFIWLLNKLESKYIKYAKENYESKFNCIDLAQGTLYSTCEDYDYYNKRNYEIISFSQYCAEQGIKEPIFIQGFEVKCGYNDVVMVSDDNESWYLEKLVGIKKHPVQGWQFETQLTYYRYCRLLKRSEINEIKFID